MPARRTALLEDPIQQLVAELLLRLGLQELAEVRRDRRIGDRALDLQRDRVADEILHRLAVLQRNRFRELRLELVVEVLLDELERAVAGYVHERRPREQVVALRDARGHGGRALDHLVVGLLRLAAGRRRRALREVVGLTKRRAHVEAADRAVADLERDLAAGRAHVLDHRAAVAGEVEIEAAVASEVRLLIRERSNQRLELESRRLAGEREARL